MLNISSETKALLQTDSVYKEMTVVMYDGDGHRYTYTNDRIYYESFELSESILDGNTMTFMGCISNEMRVTVRNTDNLGEDAFNGSTVTVKVMPYNNVPTKNLMQNAYGAGVTDEMNGVSVNVKSDLSIDVSGTATDGDFELSVGNLNITETRSLYLSGCKYGGGVADGVEGILSVTHTDGTVTTYKDIGQSDSILVSVTEGDVCEYTIHVYEGHTANTTFSVMLRETTETAEYEPYGYKLVETEEIPLFFGYVDSGEFDHDRAYLRITAYDALYYLNSFNIWNWYKDAFDGGAKTLSYLLEDFADYVNAESGYDFELSETECPVILSNVKIKKRLSNRDMTATNFLKSFCQLSCACAQIDRTGKLKLVYLGSGITQDEYVSYYREVSEKDFVVRPFSEGITLRTNSDDNGVTVESASQIVTELYAWTGETTVYTATEEPAINDIIYDVYANPTGLVVRYYDDEEEEITASNSKVYDRDASKDTSIWDDESADTYIVDDDDDTEVETGKYFIENNGIVKKLSKKKRTQILNILLNVVQNDYYKFKSYNLKCNGLPYLECGDRIGYKYEGEHEVEVELVGSQAIIDNTNGGKAFFSVTWEALSTMTIYPNTYIAVFNYKVVPPLVDQPYYGLSMQDMANVVGMSQVNEGDRLVMTHVDGVSHATYSRYENGEYTDFDVSNCIYRQGSTAYNCDTYLVANEAENTIQLIPTAYGNCNAFVTYMSTQEMIKWQYVIANRKLTGIQAMVDEFTFELPNNAENYGGTTSGLSDDNISGDTTTASETLAGETVITLVSFENGVLRTSSRKI